MALYWLLPNFHLFEISVPLFLLLQPYVDTGTIQINYIIFPHSFLGCHFQKDDRARKTTAPSHPLLPPPKKKTPKGKKTLHIIQDRQLHKVLISDPKNHVKAMERFTSPEVSAFLSRRKLAVNKQMNEAGWTVILSCGLCNAKSFPQFSNEETGFWCGGVTWKYHDTCSG